LCRHQGLGAYSAAIGLINRSSARLHQVRPRVRAYHCSSGLPLRRPFGPHRRCLWPRRWLPRCLLSHVRHWWFSHRCTDSRPAAAPSHRAVASLHVVIAITSHGCRRPVVPPWSLSHHRVLPRLIGALPPHQHGYRAWPFLAVAGPAVYLPPV
jgi:hypothetical protein